MLPLPPATACPPCVHTPSRPCAPALLPADSDDDDEDGKQKVSGPSREDVYSAFHKGTNSSKKKKQAS